MKPTWFMGMKPRKIHPDNIPGQYIESKKAFCMRAIEHLLNNGVTNFQDISLAIRNYYSVTSSDISNAKRELLKTYSEKLNVLNPYTKWRTRNFEY